MITDGRKAEPAIRADRQRLARLAQKAGQELIAMLGQHRLGVELHPDDRVIPMLNRHDLSVVRGSGDSELRRKRSRRDDERVIAGCKEGIG